MLPEIMTPKGARKCPVYVKAIPLNFNKFKLTAFRKMIYFIIIWRSISMRAGPAFLQFDWSKAGLSMDLPVFVYSHTKTSFKFLSRQGRYREAFYVVGDDLLQTTQREPYRALVSVKT